MENQLEQSKLKEIINTVNGSQGKGREDSGTGAGQGVNYSSVIKALGSLSSTRICSKNSIDWQRETIMNES